MYLSFRASQVRNFSVAFVNGTITLVILLIAPLGLAAVIMNTALVTVASYLTALGADWVVRYLQPGQVRAEMGSSSSRSAKLRRRVAESDLSQYE